MNNKIIKKLVENSKKKYTYFSSLEFIFYWILALLIISTTFDFSVTYFNYNLKGDDFFNYENNSLFKWGLSNNIPAILNPSVFGQIILIAFYCDIFYLYKKHNNKFFGLLFNILTVVNITLIAGHFVGGFSWFY